MENTRDHSPTHASDHSSTITDHSPAPATKQPHENPSLHRINIVGTSGSGKTTFGQKLAAKLNVPFTSLDELHWEPNWTEASNEVFFERVARVTSAERWVVDGNYDKARGQKWKHVTAIIWLDFSFARTLVQVTWRTLKRAALREILWAGNRESLYMTFFTKQSIIWWMITTHKKNKIKFAAIEKNPPPNVRFIRLRNLKQTEQFLASL